MVHVAWRGTAILEGIRVFCAGMGGAFTTPAMQVATPVKPVLTLENDIWVIRLENNSTGKIQEYRCATEAQAKQLALVLTPKEQR